MIVSHHALLNTPLTNEFFANVLIVDADIEIATLLVGFLERHACRVFLVAKAEAMWQVLDRSPVDIVIIDPKTPGIDGLSICKELRASRLSVVMLANGCSLLERVTGLENGADDYVCKPFDPLELLSRIRSVLRRTQSQSKQIVSAPDRIRFGRWMLDIIARHLVNPEGGIVSLSGAEFRLLNIFLDHPNTVLNRDYLMNLTCGRNAYAIDRSLDLQVSRLRQKIEGDSKFPTIIKTVRNQGYVLAATVKFE